MLSSTGAAVMLSYGIRVPGKVSLPGIRLSMRGVHR